VVADVVEILVSVVIAVVGFLVVILVCAALLALFARILPAPADPDRHLRTPEQDEAPAEVEEPAEPAVR
jgi:hypothetical protein